MNFHYFNGQFNTVYKKHWISIQFHLALRWVCGRSTLIISIAHHVSVGIVETNPGWMMDHIFDRPVAHVKTCKNNQFIFMRPNIYLIMLLARWNFRIESDSDQAEEEEEELTLVTCIGCSVVVYTLRTQTRITYREIWWKSTSKICRHVSKYKNKCRSLFTLLSLSLLWWIWRGRFGSFLSAVQSL